MIVGLIVDGVSEPLRVPRARDPAGAVAGAWPRRALLHRRVAHHDDAC